MWRNRTHAHRRRHDGGAGAERGLTHLTQCPRVEIRSINKARLIETLDHRASEEEDANEKKEPERKSSSPGVARGGGVGKSSGCPATPLR